jgi:hypothetical protein
MNFEISNTSMQHLNLLWKGCSSNYSTLQKKLIDMEQEFTETSMNKDDGIESSRR